MSQPPSYQLVIDLLNKLKKYYMMLFPPRISHSECTTKFHGKLSQQSREELLDELHNLEEHLKKMPLPKNTQALLNRKFKVFGAHLTKEHDADKYPELFVSTICMPLKEEFITVYRHDADKIQWLLAGFAIFEKQ